MLIVTMDKSGQDSKTTSELLFELSIVSFQKQKKKKKELFEC
jgi:hypothetical protein